MLFKLTPYRILRWAYVLCAIGVALLVWAYVPVVGMPWHSLLWFCAFATLAELLGVSLGEERQVEVTPTSPVYWAATCVLGPIPAIAVCGISALLADVIAFTSYTLARRRSAALQPAEDVGASDTQHMPQEDTITRLLRKGGTIWESKAGWGTLMTVESSLHYVAALVMIAGLSGVAYYCVGGVFLVQNGHAVPALMHFALPFLVLVTVAVAVEHSLHVAVMAVLDPIPGVKGVYGVLLKMKLVFIENTLPLCRAELFLVIVALLLSYLYAHLGVLGFVLTAMPVLALRDFFYNWVAEKAAYADTITTLATCMQLYHPYTRGHLTRVADMSSRLARELRLPAESIRHISYAGFLHDIGKIGVSEEILDKPGKPNDEEWATIKEHPVKGAEIISHIEFLEGIVDWIKYHHKWYNGAGYPNGGGNGDVPIEASIIAVADSFDAMTDDRELGAEWKCDSCGYMPTNGERPSECPECGAVKRRTYREPRPLDEAVNELRRGAGSQFHPRVVRAFLTMVERDGIHQNA